MPLGVQLIGEPATMHGFCARPIGWSINLRIDPDLSARRVTGLLLFTLEQRLPVVAPEAPEHQRKANQDANP